MQNSTEERINNPPGMWSGFYARLPDCNAYSPRVGIYNGMELTIRDRTEYATPEEAMMAGRVAAWERYDEWQAKAPEKTLSRFICDQRLAALADVAPDATTAHAPVDGPERED